MTPSPPTEPSAKRAALVASYAPSLTLFRGDLIREIRARGHQVLCLAPDFDDAVMEALDALGVETRTVPLERTGLNPAADLKTIKALTAIFREWQPDVVMGYTPKPSIYAALAAKRAGVAHIVPMITGLGYAFLEGAGLKGWVLRQIQRWLYARALARSDCVIFHNEDDRRVMTEFGCVPERLPAVVVRGSGVDLDRYTEQPLPAISRGLTFLMISRLVRYKGVGEYCAAAWQLKSVSPASRWLLVGPEESGPAGFPRRELERYEDAVTYLGPTDDVRPYLKDCHVYVLPSYGEGMPRTVLEALATGRPVIATDTRGCRETVQHDINGLLVPVGDADALADAMSAILKRPDWIPRMARKSRLLAEAEFDVKRVNETMLGALGLIEDASDDTGEANVRLRSGMG